MSPAMIDLFITSFGETLLMIGVSGLVGLVLGGLLGLFLYMASHGAISAPAAHRFLNLAAHAVQSTPAIILLATAIPLTHVLLGSSVGMGAAIAPLTIIATSFVTRHVESALDGVDRHVIEAAQTMGATHWQIIHRVLIPEASAGIVAGLGITLASLVGYSALAGAIGGGGLGDLGIRYGYQEFLPEVMLLVVLMLVGLAETFHVLGGTLAHRLNQR
ncbi:ABC transporter permease subunit [Pusillimonas sp. SM2304]|uniref:ABC transporter permease subunit n=1 Tax=Pusillimonas sp. SM2304 TaxID=3073241 RepID=UPI002876B23C|nr:ABC transporter permease subunit [Pusillimonas sp. SM2304]MDS1140745.1 ABC transporter permease subunit [Pusillimonas sp. SM2304]